MVTFNPITLLAMRPLTRNRQFSSQLAIGMLTK
jgi:hypothetical protein